MCVFFSARFKIQWYNTILLLEIILLFVLWTSYFNLFLCCIHKACLVNAYSFFCLERLFDASEMVH